MKKGIAIGLGVFGVLIIAFAAFALTNNAGNAGNSQPTGLAVLKESGQVIEGDFVKIPVSEISSNAKWFSYDSQGVKIKYLAVKGSDGSIRTAFDACDVCFGAKKGYRQEGSFLVCNNCGKKFAIDSIGVENKTPGGCWPGYLPSTVSGSYLLIKKTDMESGKYRFA